MQQARASSGSGLWSEMVVSVCEMAVSVCEMAVSSHGWLHDGECL